MGEKLTPQREKEETLAYIELEQPIWSDFRERVRRTAGLDAELNQQFKIADNRMNHLLEDLFAQNVILGLSNGNSEGE